MSVPTRKPLVPSAFQNVWGIFYDDLTPVFEVDTYLGIDYKAKTKVSHFPVERGGFVDYNKVREPFEIRARFAVGGDSVKIVSVLTALETEKNSTTLYRVVTPEQTYVDLTLVSYDYKRSQDKGHNQIVADLALVEIRQVDSAYATVKIPPTKAKDKNSPDKKNVGQKEPQKTFAIDNHGILRDAATQADGEAQIYRMRAERAQPGFTGWVVP